MCSSTIQNVSFEILYSCLALTEEKVAARSKPSAAFCLSNYGAMSSSPTLGHGKIYAIHCVYFVLCRHMPPDRLNPGRGILPNI